ncbi:MAG: UDP-N-acetylmuramyl-tripeptide synthetase [Candidatus Portnoybacteria bacterium]|nr:UDP-N-acetylmuramyl-tripeptide synthetase [Candidatus Portnoybacteria bacterium]
MKKLIKKLIPKSVLNLYHLSLVWLGSFLYNHPSKKLTIIGITGTGGKSTTVHLATQVLEKAFPGQIASLSSIRFKAGKEEWPNMLKMTMPGRMKIQKFLKKAVKNHCKYAVLEVTSEGIKQNRHRFIEFNGAVFTNLSKEHIEAHKGFENYKKAKGELFKALNESKKQNKFAIINIDDPNAQYFLNIFKGKTYTYAVKNKQANITPEKINIETPLPGEFNKYNSLAAAAIGISQGIGTKEIIEALKEVREVPGRMELAIGYPFKVFVDYAHTPDSLEKVYTTIKESDLNNNNSKLICVLGSCGGGRDKWKRPEMGKIASDNCNKIILTNEDPYDENPEKIIQEVKKGIQNPETEIIIDRRKAINKALSLAKTGDVVAITGKGSEPWMCVAGNKKIPWDDRKIAKEEYKKIKEK